MQGVSFPADFAHFSPGWGDEAAIALGSMPTWARIMKTCAGRKWDDILFWAMMMKNDYRSDSERLAVWERLWPLCLKRFPDRSKCASLALDILVASPFEARDWPTTFEYPDRSSVFEPIRTWMHNAMKDDPRVSSVARAWRDRRSVPPAMASTKRNVVQELHDTLGSWMEEASLGDHGNAWESAKHADDGKEEKAAAPPLSVPPTEADSFTNKPRTKKKSTKSSVAKTKPGRHGTSARVSSASGGSPFNEGGGRGGGGGRPKPKKARARDEFASVDYPVTPTTEEQADNKRHRPLYEYMMAGKEEPVTRSARTAKAVAHALIFK
jgi:uncharacterized membrane protein YgcG